MICLLLGDLIYCRSRSDRSNWELQMTEINLTNRQEVMIFALASEHGAEFAPVQVQKLFFLLDANVSNGIGGKQFDFEPYDYGPFDKSVYRELEILEQHGLVRIERGRNFAGGRKYSLTTNGQLLGQNSMSNLTQEVRDYILKVAQWVRGLSFAELVGSIYTAYPEMKANSIFEN